MKKYKIPTAAEVLLYATYLLVGLAELLIGFRVLLKMFGANASAPFVNWVYETSAPLLAPFSGMFPAPKIDGLFVIEFSALFALLVFALIAYFIESLINFVDSKQ